MFGAACEVKRTSRAQDDAWGGKIRSSSEGTTTALAEGNVVVAVFAVASGGRKKGWVCDDHLVLLPRFSPGWGRCFCRSGDANPIPYPSHCLPRLDRNKNSRRDSVPALDMLSHAFRGLARRGDVHVPFILPFAKGPELIRTMMTPMQLKHLTIPLPATIT